LSTILDALKRLDEETRTRDAKHAPTAMTGSGMAAGESVPRRRRVLWIGLALIVMGAVGWWSYREGGGNVPALKPSRPDKSAVTAIPAAVNKSASMAPIPERSLVKGPQPSQADVTVAPPKPVASVQANSQTRLTPSSNVPMNAERSKTRSISPESLSIKPSTGNRHRKPIPSIDQTSASRPQKSHVVQPHRSTSTAMTSQTASITADKKTPPPSGTNATAYQSKRHNPPLVSPALPATAQSPYANAEPLVSDTMQVQAISWSDRPTKRIAVIDGRIVREGQSVHAYQVIQIRPEDVIIEKSGKFWKLAFGSH
jgi:Type II secretion system protein B